MLPRREVFPHVIEMNYQARQRLGCSVYLVHDAGEWLLIDIGFEDTAEEIIDMIRQMDFSLANCKYLVATHADVDHIQGLKRAKELLPNAITIGHPECRRLLAAGDRIVTYAEIAAQKISINLPIINLEQTINEGDTLTLGSLSLEVWNTPGHTSSQLAFRLGDLLFSGPRFSGADRIGRFSLQDHRLLRAPVRSSVALGRPDCCHYLAAERRATCGGRQGRTGALAGRRSSLHVAPLHRAAALGNSSGLVVDPAQSASGQRCAPCRNRMTSIRCALRRYATMKGVRLMTNSRVPLTRPGRPNFGCACRASTWRSISSS